MLLLLLLKAELRNTSVYAPDAQFVLWLAETAVHLEAYLTKALLEEQAEKGQQSKAHELADLRAEVKREAKPGVCVACLS